MSTLELKNEFHNLIDKIKDKALLENFFSLLSSAHQSGSASLIDQLSDGEREELFLSDDESKSAEDLLSNDEMKAKHKRWL